MMSGRALLPRVLTPCCVSRQGRNRGRLDNMDMMAASRERRRWRIWRFETKWKKGENKIQQHDGFASTSLVHSPCLSLVGLWHSVDVLNTVGLPVGGATVSSALPLLHSYTDMMCLTKAGGTEKVFRIFKKYKRRRQVVGKCELTLIVHTAVLVLLAGHEGINLRLRHLLPCGRAVKWR